MSKNRPGWVVLSIYETIGDKFDQGRCLEN